MEADCWGVRFGRDPRLVNLLFSFADSAGRPITYSRRTLGCRHHRVRSLGYVSLSHLILGRIHLHRSTTVLFYPYLAPHARTYKKQSREIIQTGYNFQNFLSARNAPLGQVGDGARNSRDAKHRTHSCVRSNLARRVGHRPLGRRHRAVARAHPPSCLDA